MGVNLVQTRCNCSAQKQKQMVKACACQWYVFWNALKIILGNEGYMDVYIGLENCKDEQQVAEAWRSCDDSKTRNRN